MVLGDVPGGGRAPAVSEPTPVNYHDRILVTGKTGSGKTVFVQQLFTGMLGAQRVAIDPKGRLRLGVDAVRHPASIDWREPVIHYIPRTLDRDEYDELYEELYRQPGPRVVWLDEAQGPTRANFAPQFLRILVQQGRELGVGHFTCSQRPHNIEMTLRSEPEHLFMFVPSPHRRDLEALALEVGCAADELDVRMRDLAARCGPHSFLWYDRHGDELHDCAPITP